MQTMKPEVHLKLFCHFVTYFLKCWPAWGRPVKLLLFLLSFDFCNCNMNQRCKDF